MATQRQIRQLRQLIRETIREETELQRLEEGWFSDAWDAIKDTGQKVSNFFKGGNKKIKLIAEKLFGKNSNAYNVFVANRKNLRSDSRSLIEGDGKAIGYQEVYASHLEYYNNEKKELMLISVEDFRELILAEQKRQFIASYGGNLQHVIEALKSLGDLGNDFAELDSPQMQKKVIKLLSQEGILNFSFPDSVKDMLTNAKESAKSHDLRSKGLRDKRERDEEAARRRGFESPEKERENDELSAANYKRKREEEESERRRQKYLDDTYGGRNFEWGEATHDLRDR
jgi:hypothetical protein